MLKTTKKLNELNGEITGLIVEKLSTPETFMNMNQDEFKFLQLCLNYINESNKLMIETVELLERVDKNVGKLASNSYYGKNSNRNNS